MGKKYFLALILFIGSFNLFAITYTSTSNGSWTTPTTWVPFGVPLPGDNVVINHNVTLNTDFAYTVGSITVNSSGSLIQDITGRDVWVNGVNASFTNSGTTTIRNLLLSIGSFSNTGTFNVKVIANSITMSNTGNINGVDSLLNNGIINNNGTINIMTFQNNNVINNYNTIQGLTTVVDSIYNVGTFLNDVGALLKADSCTNSGTLTNNGAIYFNQYTNAGVCNNNNYLSFVDLTNINGFINSDSLIGIGSMTNIGNFNNQNGAYLDLGISFLNTDPINMDAVFNNDGVFNIGDSFYNFDTITGGVTGSFIVQDTSYNSDRMRGSFDFCDLTPPATPIKIDFNLGTVDPNITYCTSTSLDQVSESSIISIYPNPTNGILNIKLEGYFTADVYNVLGEKILTRTISNLDLSSYQNGVYFVLVKDKSGTLLKYEKVIKN